LLVKTLDCNDVLSVQVHPDDELAKERHNSYGKTEMWYVIDAEPGSYLYVGFKDSNITREEFLEATNNDTLPDILNKVEVKAGDVFFIPAGTIHALGKGIKVIEIQQTSDITYRVYDWNRVDRNGNARELHTSLAVDAIDFATDNKSYLVEYQKQTNKSVKVVDCPHFTTNIIALEGEKEFDYASLDSFVLYVCTEGEAEVAMGEYCEKITPYELVMIPAEADVVTLSGKATLLEVYIK
jgi:mannose-6-phosphate isomerase